MNDAGFAGTNGFIWFTGVIEDLEDKTMYSRAKVRVIGWHTPQKSKLPTAKLPWAQVVLPVTGAYASSQLRQNDWVFGFFQDGDAAQMPVIMGVYPSRNSVLTVDVDQNGYGVSPNLDHTAKPPAGTRVGIPGQPSTPMTGRSVVSGTVLDWTNNKLEAVCDISGEVKMACGWVKVQFGVIMEKIKEAWAWLVKAIGLTPSGTYQEAITFLKRITAELKVWAKLIKEATEFSKLVLEYAKLVRAIIDFIMSLPEKLLKLLAACIKQLSNALKDGFSDLFSGMGGVGGADGLGDLLKEVEAIGSAAGDVLKSTMERAALPAQFLDVLSTPASSEDINKVAAAISNYTNSNPPEPTTTSPYESNFATP